MNKNKVRLISVIAALAVVGTASAAWVFTKNAESTYTISTTLETYSQVGNITVTDKGNPVALDLDQGDGTSNGITWKNATGTDEGISAKYTSTATIDESKLTRTWTLTLSEGLLEYVDYPSSTASYQNVAWTDDTNITLPQLTWKTNKKPTSVSEYNTMNGKLSTFTTKITFKVVISN